MYHNFKSILLSHDEEHLSTDFVVKDKFSSLAYQRTARCLHKKLPTIWQNDQSFSEIEKEVRKILSYFGDF